ncbi:MAG: alpha/beta hydrolase [Planctomycetes bacterium]|nr:alpha/beta hydrolase [Planctomycetota bacterium]
MQKKCILTFLLLSAISSAVFADGLNTVSAEIREYLATADPAKEKELIAQITAKNLDLAYEDAVKFFSALNEYGKEKSGAQLNIPFSFNGTNRAYSIYVPSAYDTAKEYPLLVMMHGAGFQGDAYIGRYGDFPEQNGYVLLCPSGTSEWWSDTEEAFLVSIIGSIRTKYRIDPDRIFLAGFSNGGIGTWSVGLHNPDLFAGLLPMAGALNEAETYLLNSMNLPILMLHGTKDNTIPFEAGKEAFNKITALKHKNIRLLDYPEEKPMAGGHFFPTHKLQDVFDWLADKNRNAFPSELNCASADKKLNSFYWLKLDDFTEMEITASVINNKIAINIAGAVNKLTVRLNDKMIDYSKPVEIVVNGKTVFNGMALKNAETLLTGFKNARDCKKIFFTEIRIDAAVNVPIVKKEEPLTPALIEKIVNAEKMISFIVMKELNEDAELKIIPKTEQSRGSLFFKGVENNESKSAEPVNFKPGDEVHFMQRDGWVQEMMDPDARALYIKKAILGWEDMMAGAGGGMNQMPLCPESMFLYKGTVTEVKEGAIKVKVLGKQKRIVAAYNETTTFVKNNQNSLLADFAKGDDVKIGISRSANNMRIVKTIQK